MKKALLILLLIVIIAAQWTFISSFHSELEDSHGSGKRGVVASKLNYITMRVTIKISPMMHPGAEPVWVTFSNDSQLEITEPWEMQVLMPKTGNVNEDFMFNTFLSLTPTSEGEMARMTLSHNKPIDVDVAPDGLDFFFQTYYDPHPDWDVRDETDVYWLIVEGDGTVVVSGYGGPF
jgi:mannose-6-phosphate isomerase-like protein (cupin superfamily)